MKIALEDIVKLLDAGSFTNEQSIKNGIILRILNELGWPTYNPQSVFAEFPVETGRVDFALCTAPQKPSVFIEVKQAATFSSGEDQLLLKYAFIAGVKIAVLTDGQRWHFYLPMEGGSFQDRRFFQFDLFEKPLDEVEQRLRRYLDFDAISNGKAVRDAKSDYEARIRSKAAAAEFPRAWAELISEPDERLVVALSEKVESSTGFVPIENEVREFIKSRLDVLSQADKSKIKLMQTNSTSRNTSSPVSAEQNNSQQLTNATHWFAIDGQKIKESNVAKDILVGVFQALVERSPQFPEQYAAAFDTKFAHKKTLKRRWIAQSINELYANESLVSEHAIIGNGWFVGTNYSNSTKIQMLGLTKDVAKGLGIELQFKI